MIAGMTYYEILWFFLLYSFVGWVVEVAYHGAVAGVIVNRGFLNGPVCPVYGIGVISVLILIGFLPDGAGTKPGPVHLLLVFLVGLVFASTVELAAGWLLDRLFHARWWDYSNRPLNLHGYICLSFSLIWGLGITFIVRIWHPEVTCALMRLLRHGWGKPVLLLCYAAFIADVAVSAAVVAGLDKDLAALDKARAAMRLVSDGLSERIGSESLRTMQAFEKGQVQAALGKAEFLQAASERKEDIQSAFAERKEGLEAAAGYKKEEIEKQIETLLKHLSSGQAARILKAFPDIKHRNYTQTLEELKRKVAGAYGRGRKK